MNHRINFFKMLCLVFAKALNIKIKMLLFTTSQVQRIERTSQLFVRRLYESAFIDLSLLLNTKMKVPRAQNQER